MSDKLGPLSFGKRDELVFLGREIGEQRNYSDEVAKQIDEEVRAIIDARVCAGDGRARQAQGQADGPRREARRRGDGRQRGVREALHRHPAEGEPARRRTADRRAGRADPDARCPSPPRTETNHSEKTGPRGPVFSHGGGPADMSEDALEAHLTANREQRMEAYKAFLTIPSISALPAAQRRLAAGRRVARGAPCGEPASSTSPSNETGGNPIVYGDWLNAGAERPDGHRLRPLRRPAGRSARPLGVAAVHARSSRATGSRAAASPTTRARS